MLTQQQPGEIKPYAFNDTFAPPTSTWKPPKWMFDHSKGSATAEIPDTNGLGEPFDWRKPTFRGIDLTKPDPRLLPREVSIDDGTTDDNIVAIIDVNILDSTGAQPYRGDVLVQGKRITSVGKKLTEDELRGARIIQGKGRTLMSGMCDAHTHYSWSNAASLDGLADLPVEDHTLFAMGSARTFLDCGYTMTFGAASAKDRLDIAVRNFIREGGITGPRTLANCREMAPSDGALIPGITAFIETPEEAVAMINRSADLGADQVKLSMSGEEITEHLRAEDPTFPDDLVAACVEAAHARGMKVCSHARADAAIVQCLQYGVDVIYHASFISEPTMEMLEVQKDRVVVAPALNWLVATVEDAAAFGYPQSKAESVGYKRELEIAVSGLKEMKRRGIKVLIGGDYGFAWLPHGTYRDPELFVKRLGFSPMDAVLSATTLGAELMGHPEELGKIQQGYYADLLLVNGNPLEDITLLSHHENLDLIMINGRIHKEQNKDHDSVYESVKADRRFPENAPELKQKH